MYFFSVEAARSYNLAPLVAQARIKIHRHGSLNEIQITSPIPTIQHLVPKPASLDSKQTKVSSAVKKTSAKEKLVSHHSASNELLRKVSSHNQYPRKSVTYAVDEELSTTERSEHLEAKPGECQILKCIEL